MGERRFRIQVPVDPSHGVTVRLFASAVADGVGSIAPLGDDLRLVLTELLANAVERPAGAATVTIELTPGDDAIRCEVTGVGELGASDGPVDRWRIIEALCGDLRTDDTAGGSLSATMTSPG